MTLGIRKQLEDKRRNTNVKKRNPTFPGETSAEIVVQVKGICDQTAEHSTMKQAMLCLMYETDRGSVCGTACLR